MYCINTVFYFLYFTCFAMLLIIFYILYSQNISLKDLRNIFHSTIHIYFNISYIDFINTYICNTCIHIVSDFSMILVPPTLLFFISLCFFLFVCLWVYYWFLVCNRLYSSYWNDIVLVQYSIVPPIFCLMYLFYIHSAYDFGHLSLVSFILIITSF